MITIECINRSCFGRRLLVVVMIACFCFSTGEGLRLTPFTVSELQQPQASEGHVHKAGWNELTNRYNATILPKRPMKRSTEVADFENQPPQSSRELKHEGLVPVTAE